MAQIVYGKNHITVIETREWIVDQIVKTADRYGNGWINVTADFETPRKVSMSIARIAAIFEDFN